MLSPTRSTLLFGIFIFMVRVANGCIPTIARIFPNASRVHGTDENLAQSWNLQEYNWTSQNDIEIVKYIDSGRFSTVFQAFIRKTLNGDLVPIVVKILKPTFVNKMKREIKLLELLNNSPGVIKLLGMSKNSGCQTVSLLFESLGDRTRWLSHQYSPLTSFEVKFYTLKLLMALKECHSLGIMHRDIKPRNVIIQQESTQLRIIDMGLSELYVPGKRYNPSVASRHYKAPELLFEYLFYDYAIDIWSVGCLFAGMIFMSEPFFQVVIESSSSKMINDNSDF